VDDPVSLLCLLQDSGWLRTTRAAVVAAHFAVALIGVALF
jgi:hypothetical protein